MKKIIAISGLAGDGKDTLCEILAAYFKLSGYSFQRVSLADSLKLECAPAMKEIFNIDPRTCSREDKEKIRDYLVFYAKVKRIQSNGTYWTSIIDKIIKEDKVQKSEKKIYCIPDVRHALYSNDEVQWIKKNNGLLIHVKKFQIENVSPYRVKYSIPVNNEEAINTPAVEALADFILEINDCYPKKPQYDTDCLRAISETFEKIIDLINEAKRLPKSQKPI